MAASLIVASESDRIGVRSRTGPVATLAVAQPPPPRAQGQRGSSGAGTSGAGAVQAHGGAPPRELLRPAGGGDWLL